MFDVLVCEVAGRTFGLPATVVREVVRAVAVTPLPRAPGVIEGVINVRGRVIAVLDLRRRFRLPARAVVPSDHFVLVDAAPFVLAMRTDRVLELRGFPDAAVDEARRVIPYAEYVAGVARLDDGLLLLHDVTSFLAQGEAVALAGAMTRTEAQG